MNHNSKLQIIFLKPVFVPKIWGSQKLANQFGFNLPKDVAIGEAWLISAHQHGMSYVLNTEYKGLSLAELFAQHPTLFGNLDKNGQRFYEEYPLLTKILDANDSLSVQIHPNNDYAKRHHNSLGKTECWYVIDCQPQSQIILGHNATSKKQFDEWVDKGQWDKLLKYVPIVKDQFVYVPATKIHGILPNTIIFELQQSCDITYRLYDYNRRDENGNLRALHLKEAKDIVKAPDVIGEQANNHDRYLVDNQFFKLVKINNENMTTYSYPQARWLQATVLAGAGEIDGTIIKKGDSFILPHGYNKFVVTGKLMMMVSYC